MARLLKQRTRIAVALIIVVALSLRQDPATLSGPILLEAPE